MSDLTLISSVQPTNTVVPSSVKCTKYTKRAELVIRAHIAAERIRQKEVGRETRIENVLLNPQGVIELQRNLWDLYDSESTCRVAELALNTLATMQGDTNWRSFRRHLLAIGTRRESFAALVTHRKKLTHAFIKAYMMQER